MAYQIQQGDTLSAIARDNNTTVDTLMALNKDTVKDKDLIYTGNTLNLGAPSSEGLAQKMDKAFAPLQASNNTPNLYRDETAKVESGPLGYTAVNEESGAYGKYQFIPDTAKYYSNKLGFKGDEWKTPENQELMYAALTQDNQKRLEKSGMPTDFFHTYLAHQQGNKGLAQILSGNPLPAVRIRNMRSNLPGSSNLPDSEVKNAYLSYWRPRLANIQKNTVRI